MWNVEVILGAKVYVLEAKSKVVMGDEWCKEWVCKLLEEAPLKEARVHGVAMSGVVVV